MWVSKRENPLEWVRFNLSAFFEFEKVTPERLGLIPSCPEEVLPLQGRAERAN